MTQAYNLSQLANKVNVSGQLDAATGLSGVAPVANGGTNNGSLLVTAGGALYTDGSKVNNIGAGTTGQVLTSQGASPPIWQLPSGGFSNMQVFTSSGTFTTPSSTTKIKITVVGGGGNGGPQTTSPGVPTPVTNYGGGGGGGATVIGVISVASSTPYPVTVGGVGGTSSFSSFASATGGATPVSSPNPAKLNGSAGGVATGASPSVIGIDGQAGATGTPTAVGAMRGGSSLFGQGGTPVSASNATGYGGGGSSGGAGTAGVVIVEW